MMAGKYLLRTILLPALVALMAGCTSPNPVLYTIAPVDGPIEAGGPPVVLLEQIALERYLERSQIVRSSENYRLEVRANDWWGEPLPAMLSRVLVTELGQRLSHSTVISEGGAVSAPPGASIGLNIRRLDEDASGRLVLQAQVSVIFRDRNKPKLRDFRFVVTPASPGTPGEVAAISAALGQLADAVARMVAEGGK